MTEWIYEMNKDNSCRYILGTVGSHPLICVGVNPSTAEPDKLDKTLESVERISANNGYDSWIMLNLYPQRATNFVDVDKSPNDEIISKNNTEIYNLLLKHKGADIWAAWGNLIDQRPYLIDCLKKINNLVLQCECNWITYGKINKSGHPHHPLYLAVNTASKYFDMKEYLAKSK